MQETKVWRKFKMSDMPRNGVYRARLVALGYSQIPGLDYTENFDPVILDMIF